MKLIHPYCKYVANLIDKNDIDKIYHDTRYGRRIKDDNELFGILLMEINQAGLSWQIILKKEKGFRRAYNNFDIKKVAKYKKKDFTRLMNDSGIIRNKLKINAAIYNAQKILELQKEYGSFRKWLDIKSKEIEQDKNKWIKEFKKLFKFMGIEIVGEFLMGINMLDGAHDKHCFVYKKILRMK